MSGIAGVFRRDGAPAGAAELEPMLAAMAFRGPDGTSQTHYASVALGHSQLCVTPESLEEQQPVTLDEPGLTLVMDGWLSNWQVLRGALLAEGCVLRNRSDPELVIHAYARWGERFTEHLEGDFAIALWDASAQRLLCVRDPIGNRPFVYFARDDLFVFATDVAAVLAHPAVPREPDLTHVANYLALNWHSAESTFWQGVQRLPAAHTLAVSARRTQKNRYWLPRLDTPLHYRDERDYVAHYRSLLFDSVRSHCRSAQPVAFEVSGGLDSSALFAVGADLHRKGTLPAPGLRGYTMDYSDDPDANELDYCRAVAAQVGLPITEVAPTLEPVAVLRQQAQAEGVPPGVPNGRDLTGLMQQARAAGARLLLNGLGGDEWLGTEAPNIYALLAHAGAVDGIVEIGAGGPRTLLRDAAALALPPEWLTALRQRRLAACHAAVTSNWLKPAMTAHLAAPQAPWITLPIPGVLDRADMRTRLAYLLDPAAAHARESQELIRTRCGIEGRSPLAARALVQFAFDVPVHRLCRRGVDRRLHRQALTRLLPEKVLARDDKAEFSVAYARYFTRDWEQALAQQLSIAGDWVQADRVRAAFAGCLAGERDPQRDQALWRLFECTAVLPGGIIEVE